MRGLELFFMAIILAVIVAGTTANLLIGQMQAVGTALRLAGGG